MQTNDYRARVKALQQAAAEDFYGLQVIRADKINLSDPLYIPRHDDVWGKWRLNCDDGPPSLDFGDYQITLKRLKTPDAFMGWITHLWGKTWGREHMGDFVDAVLSIWHHGFLDLSGNHQKIRQGHHAGRVPA